jgi:stage II sporulation protein AB (anti-sigma F factor)
MSEAVTNCIVHAYKGYGEKAPHYVYISVRLYDDREITMEISDNGCGIENVDMAMQPMYTTGEPGERCGMGFLVMDSFTDSLIVKSRVGKGTSVLMKKILAPVSVGGK